jgi:hypothetical protein
LDCFLFNFELFLFVSNKTDLYDSNDDPHGNDDGHCDGECFRNYSYDNLQGNGEIYCDDYLRSDDYFKSLL